MSWTEASYLWLQENSLADISSVLSFPLAVFGFVVTFVMLVGSKRAARQAKEAADQARKAISTLDVVNLFSLTISAIDDIKILNRERKGDRILEKYSAVKKNLIAIRTLHPDLTDPERASIQGMITDIVQLENALERALEAGRDEPIAKINKNLSEKHDLMYEMLVAMKASIGD